MAELRVADLEKSFAGQGVLRGVSLTVPTGRLVAILGASGSGKTTLLRLIAGFERPDRGSIAVDGATLAGAGIFLAPERRRIGYVAQDGALFPHLTVAENIAFGLPRAARRAHARVGALLAMVGLPASYADRAPQALSGGEQQRVALARALAPEPRLVLLDEPFSALDAALRAETREVVADALARAGATAVLVTHDQAEALSIGHRVAVLRDGRLVQYDDPMTLYRAPHDAALARFIGEAVVLAGTARAGRVRCALGQWDIATIADGAVDVVIRPEQLRLSPDPAAAPLTARVGAITFYGHDARVDLTLADGTAIFARLAGHRLPDLGAEIGVSVDGAVMAFPAG
ncbi:MAG: ABC transporter ATP-binding protein [Rhodospirillales bacterium]|nr:ABC transporter ATP-binding protein [Rhodospirillales bacterium]